MQAIVALLAIPLMVLNYLGGIGSGIWLGILGEWWAIGYGLAALLAHFVLAFALMPALLFLGPAAALADRLYFAVSFVFVLLGNLYIYAVVTFWCLFVLVFFMRQSSPDTFWPLLIWSYGVAMAPWMHMASKEDPNSGGASSSAALLAQLAYVVTALMLILGSPTLVTAAIVFGSIMAIGALVQSVVGIAGMRSARSFGDPG